MTPVKRIGILTGGGDAPGLNAVIRAVVKSACNSGIECVGIEDSFDGLLEPGRSRSLTPRDVRGIMRLGGTILGTINTGNPLSKQIETSAGTREYAALAPSAPAPAEDQAIPNSCAWKSLHDGEVPF